MSFQFNAQQYQPKYGGEGGLPEGDYKVRIVASPLKPVIKNNINVGGYIELSLEVIEGAFAGQKTIDRLNVFNQNDQAVKIANEQLSAICHVVGVYQVQQMGEDVLAQMHNIPYIIRVGKQKNSEYTEIKKVFDINGNEPGKAGSGAAPQQAAPPPMQPQQPAQPQMQPQMQPQQPAGWGAPPAQQQPMPSGAAPGGNIGSWGQAPQQQPPAQQAAPAANSWGQPQMQPQQPAQPQMQPAGWGAPPAGWGQ